MKYTFDEISNMTNALEREFRALYDDAMSRYNLYTLRNEPTLPEDIAREGQVNILSSLIVKSAHSIRADLMANPTEFTVISLGRDDTGHIPNRDQKRGDTLEKALASIWARMNENRHVDREVYWHQLVSPFACLILDTVDLYIPDQKDGESDFDYADRLRSIKSQHIPWKVSVVDPLTVFFTERDGQPVIATRKYKALVKEVQDNYSYRRGAPVDAALRMNKDGQWIWITDDYEVTDFKQTSSDLMKEVEMMWIDDGEHISHVALNAQDNKGEVVWTQENPFGRVSAFIIKGAGTPLGAPEDRYEPFLWPLMQVVKDINYVRTMRATVSRNLAGPNNYIPLDSEIIKIFENANRELPRSHRWQRGETPYLLGEVKDQPQHLDQDLDKLEMRLSEDLQFLLPLPSVNVLDPAVVKDSTATAILHAAEAGMRMYGPLMSAYDSAIKSICEAIEHCITYYYDDEEEITAYATGEELARGKYLPAGSVYVFDKKLVNFPHRILVRSRSMSQAQASAQYQLALSQWILPDGSKGPMTVEGLIEAANVADVEERMEELAVEQMYVKIEPFFEEMALAAGIEEVEMKLGITIQPPVAGGLGPSANSPDPTGLPNSAQRMDSPGLNGPQGGTE